MLITFDQVTLAFGKRTIISELDLNVPTGALYGLVGPSGAGKSTILGLIAGELKPQQGKIFVAVTQNEISWIHQSSPVFERRSALENVMLGALAKGMPEESARQNARRVLTDVGLTNRSNDQAYKLSGGERQRVAVARAVVAKSRLMLVDEPTASLDAHSRKDIVDALEVATTQGVTVVVATHDRYLSNRCSQLKEIEPAGQE